MRGTPSRLRSVAVRASLGLSVGAIVALGGTGNAQQSGEWPGITGGNTSTRYSALDQINASNFSNLKVAWA